MVALSENLRLPTGSDHHLGLLQRVVTKPQLPYDPSVVAIVLGFIHVFPIEIRLEAAIIQVKLKCFSRRQIRETNMESALGKTGSKPVEPPAPAVCWSTGATLGSSVIVPVHRGELVPVVGGEAVGGVAGVATDPQLVVGVLAVHPGHGGHRHLLPEGGVVGTGPLSVMSLQLHPEHHGALRGQPAQLVVPPPELPLQVPEALPVVLPATSEVLPGLTEVPPPLHHLPSQSPCNPEPEQAKL